MRTLIDRDLTAGKKLARMRRRELRVERLRLIQDRVRQITDISSSINEIDVEGKHVCQCALRDGIPTTVDWIGRALRPLSNGINHMRNSHNGHGLNSS